MQLIESLKWRYAVKKMNGTTVPQEKVDDILHAIRLAPTSMGLQPFTVLVITDPETRKKIQPLAYDQSQVTDCSHLLIFAAWSDISVDQVDEYIDNMATTRGVSPASLTDFRQNLVNVITRNTTEQNHQWAARQTYIAFGTAICAAALSQVDATPMEGFNADAVDEAPGLKEKGLRSMTMLPLGYRDAENDWLVKLPKVRRKKEKLFILQ